MLYNDLEPANSSVWELWAAPTTGPSMNSRNHHMFSSVSEWIVREVGGVRGGDVAAACGLSSAALEMHPAALVGVSAATVRMQSRCGDVRLSYQRHGGVQCVRAPEGRSSVREGGPVVHDAVVQCGEHGGVIERVDFASWGSASGTCGAFVAHPTCHSDATADVVAAMCVGKATCSVPTSADVWAPHLSAAALATCVNDAHDPRTLALQVTCSRGHAVTASVSVPTGARAQVHLPTYGVSSVRVTEGGDAVLVAAGSVTAAAALPQGVAAVEVAARGVDDGTGDRVVVHVGSGTYDLMLQ
jgi:hypothetical protein